MKAMAAAHYAPSSAPQVATTPGNETDLFADSRDLGSDVVWPGTVRHRFVTVNVDPLTNADRFRLNLFDDVSFIVVLDSMQSLKEANGPGAGDGFIWRGHIEDVEHGQVTFVVGPSTVAANIFLPTGNDYILRYAGDGTNTVHAVYDIDPKQLPEADDEGEHAGNVAKSGSNLPAAGDATTSGFPNRDSGAPVSPPAYKETSNLYKSSAAGGDALSSCPLGCPNLIGVLVVYTPSARDVAGGSSALLDIVNLAIDYANISYDNSDIDIRIYLSNFRLVRYTDVNPGTDLARIKDPADGYMDIVHTWRNTMDYADLVTLIGCEPATPGPCSPATGVADLYNPSLPDPSAYGFSWLAVHSVSYILAHELGHNMGGGHARWNGCNGSAYYACGYGVDAGGFHTVMAYNCPSGYCKGVQHFSNPDVSYCDGGSCWPTGRSIWSSNSADNARMFNISGPVISSWR
jgi:hypothetical protein